MPDSTSINEEAQPTSNEERQRQDDTDLENTLLIINNILRTIDLDK